MSVLAERRSLVVGLREKIVAIHRRRYELIAKSRKTTQQVVAVRQTASTEKEIIRMLIPFFNEQGQSMVSRLRGLEKKPAVGLEAKHAQHNQSTHGRGGGWETQTMYRGTGEGSDVSSGFEWFSATPVLAGRYADFRGDDSEVREAEVSTKSTFNIGNGNQVLSARSLSANAMKQVDMDTVDKEVAKESRIKFLGHFGKDKRIVSDYWNSPENKDVTRDLLESFGFDSIKMVEGGETTIGVLRTENVSYVESKKDFLLRTKAAVPVDASGIVSLIFNPDEWRSELINRLLPVLAVKMAEAGVAHLMTLGIDVRRKSKKGIKHAQHDQSTHGRGGGSRGRAIKLNGSPAEVRMGMIAKQYQTFESFVDPDFNSPGRRWKYAALSANVIGADTSGMEPQDFEVRVVKVSDVVPSQSGDAYINNSSKNTAERLREYKKHKGDDKDEMRVFLDSQRMEDTNPIGLNSDSGILDGNHRHAAHVINKEKEILALVPVGKGTGKIVNFKEVYHTLTGNEKSFKHAQHDQSTHGRGGGVNIQDEELSLDGTNLAAKTGKEIAEEQRSGLGEDMMVYGADAAKSPEVDEYRNYGAEALSSYLNMGKVKKGVTKPDNTQYTKKSIQDLANRLDERLSSASAIPEGISLYSGLGSNTAHKMNDASVGDVVKLKGFTSTSINPTVTNDFTKAIDVGEKKDVAVVMKVETDGKMKGAYLGFGRLKGEQEVLLPRDIELEVVGVRDISSKVKMKEGRVLASNPQAPNEDRIGTKYKVNLRIVTVRPVRKKRRSRGKSREDVAFLHEEGVLRFSENIQSGVPARFQLNFLDKIQSEHLKEKDRTKHLSHDQSTHGRGGGGGGSSSADEALEKLNVLPTQNGWISNRDVFDEVEEGEPYEDISGYTEGDIKTERVSLDKMVSTQPVMEKSTLEQYINNPDEFSGIGMDKPLIIKAGRRYFIHDGHHRIAAWKLLGRTEADVFVLKGRISRDWESGFHPRTKQKVGGQQKFLKATTASEWADENIGNWISLVEAFEAAGLSLGIMSEIPDWMQNSIAERLQETFSESYWDTISETTMGDAERVLSEGLSEGWSIDKMATQLREHYAEGGFRYARRRSENVARTESGNALNGARKDSVAKLQKELGPRVPMKQSWLSVLGNTTRGDHADLDGVPEDEKGMWNLAGWEIPWPGHINLPPDQRCNCQCSVTIEFGMDEGAAQQEIEEYWARVQEHESKSYKHLSHDQSTHGRGGGSSSLYHGTTKQIANKIKKEGLLGAKTESQAGVFATHEKRLALSYGAQKTMHSKSRIPLNDRLVAVIEVDASSFKKITETPDILGSHLEWISPNVPAEKIRRVELYKYGDVVKGGRLILDTEGVKPVAVKGEEKETLLLSLGHEDLDKITGIEKKEEDETKHLSHDQSTHGRGGGGKSEDRLELEDTAMGMVEDGLSGSKISVKAKEEFREESKRIIGVMGDRSLEMVEENGTTMRFYSSSKKVTEAYPGEIAHGLTEVGGFYDNDTGEVHSDGGRAAGVRGDVLAHEVSHAIDRDFRFSGTREWEEVWASEHSGGQLTNYATTNAQEGFAEFGRSVLLYPFDREHTARKFPKSYAFWEKEGLI